MPRITGSKRGAGVWAPLIVIDAEVNGTTFGFEALVDSGADVTIIPGELAAVCGIDLNSLPAAQGVGAGGGFQWFTSPGKLSFRGVVFARDVHFASPGAVPGPLLGRGDFFQHFVVRFTWAKNPPVMDLDPITPTSQQKKGQP